MRKLLALAALIAASNAAAADDSGLERQKISLALDFCAGVVAQSAHGLVGDEKDEVLGRGLPGVVVGRTKALVDQAPEPGMRESFRKIFEIGDTDALRFAAFDAEPSPLKLPYAAFVPGGDVCLVVGPPDQPGSADSLRKRLSADGSTWSPKQEPDHRQLWERSAPLGEMMTLGVSDDEMMIVVALAERPIATPPEIAAIARAALTPCVEAVISAHPPAPDVFLPAFTPVETHPGEKTPELIHTTLRSQVAGPRSMLTFNTYRDYVYCALWTGDIRQPAEQVLAAVADTIAALPGIKEMKVKARQAGAADADAAKVLRSWRVTRRGAARKADITVGLRDQGIVVVTVYHSAGWFW
jgi:hypothetical protein